MRPLGTILAIVLLLLSPACTTHDEAGYAPMKTDRLLAQIAALPHVTSVDIGAYESAGIGGSQPAYRGQVQVDATADPLLVLDQVLAILWQGMAGADPDVVVHQGDALYDASSVGLGPRRLEERYGAQPGTGVPPTDKPALQLRD